VEPGKFSWTAIAAAYLRAYHSVNDHPKVFDDTLADALVTRYERDFIEDVCIKAMAAVDPELAVLDRASAFDRFFHSFQAVPEVLARARYNEEKLSEAVYRGISQYVIIGAGLDSFAFRRQDLANQVTVFELDHPSTQAFKKDRLSEIGFLTPANLVLAPIDFEKEDIASGLSRTSFDSRVPAFFSWLGVTQYLSKEAIRETLGAIRSVAPPGSELVFSYYEESCFDQAHQSAAMRQHFAIVNGLAEPFLSGLDPRLLSAELVGLGFDLLEDLGQQEQQRFFKGRNDGLWPAEFARVAFARAL